MSLQQPDRELLALLCLVGSQVDDLDRMFMLRRGWGASMDRLRYRGLVAMDSLRPSPSAIAAWEAQFRPANVPPIVIEAVPLTARKSELQPVIQPARRSGRWPEWTPDEDEQLRQAYARGDRIDLLAEQLGRTEKGTRSRARKLGLSGTHPSHGGWCQDPVWTEDELARLRACYGTMPVKKLAAELGRTRASVYTRAHALGLEHDYQRRYSADELQALRIGFDRGIAIRDLAIAMGRKPGTLSKYATSCGLHFGPRLLLRKRPTLADILALEDPNVMPVFAARRPRRARETPDPVTVDERQAAFLAGLREGGTIQAGLERAGLKKGSTSWWLQTRARDAEFAAQAEAIIAEHKEAARRQREAHRAAARERRNASERARRRARREMRQPQSAAVHARSGEIDWELARRVQADRKRVRTLAERKPTHLKELGAAAYYAAQGLAQTRAEEARRADPVEQAKIRLQRRGRIVYRASVVGGRPDRWYVSGLGSDVTAEQLLAEAERIAAVNA